MTKYRLVRRAKGWAIQKQAMDIFPSFKLVWRTLYTTRYRRLATFLLWALRSFGSK